MEEKFDVTGMTCAACQANVTRVVSKLDGVSHCDVSLLSNSMKVEFDQDKVNEQTICEAVKQIGYGASVHGQKTEVRKEWQNRQNRVESDQRSAKQRLILSLVLSLFIHYYVTAVLMEIFGMGWYPIQFVVWCIELVVIYDALMFFTKNWNVKHRAMFFFAYYLFLIIALLIRYDQGISIIQLNPFACLREIYYGSWTEWIVFAFNIGYFMFMPWVNGLFISSNKENFIVSVFIGFLCEFMQLIFHRGVFDLGDISLYVVGILLGLYVKEKYHVHLKEKSEVHDN